MSYRLGVFNDYNGPNTQEGKWSVEDILQFSREPEVNEAFETYGILGPWEPNLSMNDVSM